MTNTVQHTPGPWKQYCSTIRYTTSSGLTEKVATVHGGKFGFPHPNAYLIAAAPEMYEALKALAAEADRWISNIYCREALYKALAVIAKAEGK